jgi:ATP-dependent protease ClpP protease subunit
VTRQPLAVPGRFRPQARTTENRAPGRWYTIGNQDGDEGPAVVRLYGVIGDGWFSDVSASEFAEELGKVTADRIELHVNSPGGDVFDGVAIYNALLQHPAEVHAVVDGLAASAASFIVTAGDRVSMGRGTELMIHDAWTFTIGNAGDHREVADVLDKISDSVAGLYADRAEGDAAEWRERMRAETWYSAQEAVDAGLADEVLSRDKDSVDDAWLGHFRYAGRAKAPAPIRPVDTAPPQQSTDADDPAPAGGAPEKRPGLDAMLARADALLEGRDPDAVADPLDLARIEGRLAAQRVLDEISAG